MNIELDDLKVLLSIADNTNFREAARELGISQASVSNKVESLEKVFSNPIFVLEGKKKVFTPFGQEIVRVSRAHIVNLESELEDTEKIFNSTSRVLKIGCRPEVFSFISPSLPDTCVIEHIPMAGPMVALRVLNGEIDFGFTAIVPDSLQLLAKKSFQSHLDFCVSKSMVKKGVSKHWRDRDFLLERKALFYQNNAHLLSEVFKFNEISLKSIRPRFIANSWYILADQIEKGLGYGILPFYVKTSSSVVREKIPTKIIKPLDFFLITRKSFSKVQTFREILDIKWK